MSEECVASNSHGIHAGLRCAVVTPVGPGHEKLLPAALLSVQEAFRNDRGPFVDVVLVPLADFAGRIGRSQRRNDGIDYALENSIEWIFFLDADDGMSPEAFAAVAPYINDYDAVFGLIAECPVDAPERMALRAGQLGATTDLADILRCDPFLSLQMGHFVRTTAASAIRFDTRMDTGEDFQYYLELWHQFRCTRIDQVLFVNRRGAHSHGPRSADGGEWRSAVVHVFADFCRRHPEYKRQLEAESGHA